MKVNNVSAEHLEIDSTLRRSVKHTGQRYSTYLEEQKKNKVQNYRSLRRKQVQQEITAVNNNKIILENAIQELTNETVLMLKMFPK